MSKDHNDRLTPEQIRHFRQALGLTQEQAGKEIGGGVGAFHKYEAGKVRPSIAVERLLMLRHRLAQEARNLLPTVPEPFLVYVDQIQRLDAAQLTELLRCLLNCEAAAHQLKIKDFHVAARINSPDGGEDGIIWWRGGPCKTDFLPRRMSIFQAKAQSMLPAACAKEVVDKHGNPRPAIDKLIKSRGAYVIFCNRAATNQQISERKKAMSHKIDKVHKVHFAYYGAEKIAAWANRYASACIWIREELGEATRCFGSIDYALGMLAHAGEYCDARLDDFSRRLQNNMESEHGVARITGLSGVGKTRLCLESIRRLPPHDFLKCSTIYADASVCAETDILDDVRMLSQSNSFACVIVDDCSPDLHEKLCRIVKHRHCNVWLITLDYDMRQPEDKKQLIEIKPASDEDIEKILTSKIPELKDDNRTRIWAVRLAEGLPQMAVLLAESQNNGGSFQEIQHIAKKMLYGHEPENPDLLHTAQLVAAFGFMGFEGDCAEELSVVGRHGRDLSEQTMRRQIYTLLERRIMQARGRYVRLMPEPLARLLAEAQWRDWSEQNVRKVIWESEASRLKNSLLAGLEKLDKTHAGHRVANLLLQESERFTVANLSMWNNHKVLSVLCVIEPVDALELIDQMVSSADTAQLRELDAGLRASLVDALQKLCFRRVTFSKAAELLFRVAVSEYGRAKYGFDAPGKFVKLFSIIGATEATFGDRQRLLEGLRVDERDRNHTGTKLLIQALREPLKYFQSSSDAAEHQGGGSPLRPWQPMQWAEIFAYQEYCLRRLTRIAVSEHPMAGTAKQEIALSLRYLAGNIQGAVEETVRKITEKDGGYWPEAIEGLGCARAYDCKDDPMFKKWINKMFSLLGPESLEEKLDHWVSRMPDGFPFLPAEDMSVEDITNEEQKLQEQKIHDFASELAGNWRLLVPYLSKLLEGQQYKTNDFAYHLGRELTKLQGLDKVQELAHEALKQLSQIQTGDRNPTFIGGVLRALNETEPQAADQLLVDITSDQAHAEYSVYLVVCAGVTEQRLDMIERRLNLLPANTIRLLAYRCKHVSSLRLRDFIGKLVSMQTEYADAGLKILQSHGENKLPEELVSKLVKLASRLADEIANDMNECRPANALLFGGLFKLLVGQRASNDAMASEMARMLTQCLVNILNSMGKKNHRHMYNEDFARILPDLLNRFAPVVWPILGAAIINWEKNDQEMSLFGAREIFAGEFYGGPLLRHLPQEMLISWCEAHKDEGPRFALKVLSILDEQQTGWDPLTREIIERFGKTKQVMSGLYLSLGVCVGSRVPYLEKYKGPIQELLDHKELAVHNWAQSRLDDVKQQIEDAKVREQERAPY